MKPGLENFSYVQHDVLQSILKLNDSKYVPMVIEYGKFMRKAIEEKKAIGEDPMLYQVLVNHLSTCENIVNTLEK